MSEINIVLKPPRLEVVCFPATVAGTMYNISNKSHSSVGHITMFYRRVGGDGELHQSMCTQHTKLFQVLQSLSSLDLKKLSLALRPAATFSLCYPLHLQKQRLESENTFLLNKFFFTSLFTYRNASLQNVFVLNKSKQGLFTCVGYLLGLSQQTTSTKHGGIFF